MVNYIKADLYRITHNKKLWIYFGSLILLSAALILYLSTKGIFSYDSERFLSMINMGLTFSTLFLGIPLLLTVYEDDLKFQSLQFVLTSKINKVQFILSKLIISIITIFVPYLIMLGYSFILSLLISPMSANSWKNLFLQGILVMLSTFVYFSLGALIGYVAQSTTLGIIIYIVATSGIITTVLSMLSHAIKFLEPLIEYTPDSLITAMQGQITVTNSLSISTIILLLLYVVIASLISAIVLSKIEIKTA